MIIMSLFFTKHEKLQEQPALLHPGPWSLLLKSSHFLKYEAVWTYSSIILIGRR